MIQLLCWCPHQQTNKKLVANQDISFISFANLPIWSYMDTLPLASIEQFPQKQGVKATEILFKLLESNIDEGPLIPVFHHVVFDSRLVTNAGQMH